MAANIDSVTVSNPTLDAKANARNSSRSAPEPDRLSKLGSATREPQELRKQLAPYTTGAAPANAPEVTSKGGLTSDEARRRLAKSGPNSMPDTSAHQRRPRALPGKSRPGDACGAKVAARADRLCSTRRRVEDRTRGRGGAGRCGQAFAWRRRCGGCEAHRR
jgi:hypothetical protein